MSLLIYAKKHCANWSSSNGCHLHEIITYDPIPKATAGKCVLGDGKTCDYFRACVLPTAPPPEQNEYIKLDKSVKLVKPRPEPKSRRGLKRSRMASKRRS